MIKQTVKLICDNCERETIREVPLLGFHIEKCLGEVEWGYGYQKSWKDDTLILCDYCVREIRFNDEPHWQLAGVVLVYPREDEGE